MQSNIIKNIIAEIAKTSDSGNKAIEKMKTQEKKQLTGFNVDRNVVDSGRRTEDLADI